MTVANHAVTSVSKLHTLHLSKECVSLGFNGLGEKSPRAAAKNRRERVVDRVGLTERNNTDAGGEVSGGSSRGLKGGEARAACFCNRSAGAPFRNPD